MSRLSEISRTSLGTLMTRANEGKEPESIEIAKFLDKKGLLDGFTTYTFPPVLKRTEIHDKLLLTFLEKFPDKNRILNLGCGFCTRRQRLKLDQVYWTDIDVEEIIDIRQQVLPEMDNHFFIAMNLLKETPKFDDYDIVIAEGSLMYLPFERSQVMVILAKNIHFDVIGENRKSLRGPDQLWSYKSSEWKNMGITQEIIYHDKRDDRVVTKYTDF